MRIVRPTRPWHVFVATGGSCAFESVDSAIGFIYECKKSQIETSFMVAARNTWSGVTQLHDAFYLSLTVSDSAPAWAALEMQKYLETGR